MSAPALSVIIPVHNAAPYLAEAIASVQRQTFEDLEIIVVDDGSTDGSGAVARRHTDDARVRCVRQERRGVSGARNTGLTLARGEFVGFLDADDRWRPTKAATHLEHLRRDPSIDVSFSRYAIIDEDGSDTGRHSHCRGGSFTLRELMRQNVVWPGRPVIRRSAVERAGPFDPELATHEDFEFVLRVAALRERNTACIPEVLADYRRRPGQLTRDVIAMHEGWLLMIERVRRLAPDTFRTVSRETTARHYRYLAYLAWETGQHARSRVFLQRAWATDPLVLARDRSAWLTTAAAMVALLPDGLHAPLRRLGEALGGRRFPDVRGA